MTNIVALDNQIHRSLRVRAGASALAGDNQRFVPVLVGEFPFLVVHYPILFSKDSDTGAFFCGAMRGFDPDENLFREDGLDVYRPLNLQRGPFYTAGTELVIDLDNPLANTGKGEMLFTDVGEPTPYLQSIMALMREFRPGLEMTKGFIQALINLKLVEPIDINLAFDDGAKRNLVDLYTINQDALRSLPDAAALDLFRRGYLHLAYLMIASLKQVPVLARKRNRLILQASGALSGNPA